MAGISSCAATKPSMASTVKPSSFKYFLESFESRAKGLSILISTVFDDNCGMVSNEG